MKIFSVLLVILVVVLLYYEQENHNKNSASGSIMQIFKPSANITNTKNIAQCVSDSDCEGTDLCDLAQSPRYCVTGGDLSLLKTGQYRMKSKELITCLCDRRLLVVGDSTSRGLWAQILQLAVGKPSHTWGHTSLRNSVNIDCSIKDTNRTIEEFIVHSTYHEPLPFKATGTIFSRPYMTEYDALNYLEKIWNLAAREKTIGPNDYFLLGNYHDSWVDQLEQWILFKTKYSNTKPILVDNPFEYIGKGYCNPKMFEQTTQCVEDLNQCQNLCSNNISKCIGFSFCELEECDCNNTNSSHKFNCEINHQNGVIHNSTGEPSSFTCYNYHDFNQSFELLMETSKHSFPEKLNIIIRSASPNKNFPLEPQKLEAEKSKSQAKKLQKLFPNHSILYFDMWNRLINRRNDFFDHVHPYLKKGLDSGVYGELNYELTNDFLSLLCQI